MNSYRCTICGEAILGSKTPSDCPFCGVRERHIMDLDKVDGRNLFVAEDISDDSTKNLIQALNLETTNASFYKCASDKSDSEGMRALFKRLSKIEREHADIIRKYLGLDPIDFVEEECSTNDEENIVKAIISTKETIKFYKKASNGAPEAKISILFKALSEAEDSCLKLLESFGIEADEKEEFVPPLLNRVRSK